MISESEAAIESGLVQSVPCRFVLVTGAGRSGTSTVAGSLNHLGLHVPRPFLRTNESNPRGFFESKWPVDLHEEILSRAGVNPFDSRPDGLERVARVIRTEDRERVEAWLSGEKNMAPQILVKDPRSSWMPGIWADAAENVGTSIRYLLMLRHPAEVIESRSTYYFKGDPAKIRRYQLMSMARWVNANLMAERQTREGSRTFLRYYDLLGDWRRALSKVGSELGLKFNADLDVDGHHAVDDFVDPQLRRHHVSWEQLDMPASLRELAEETWRACGSLADADCASQDVHQRLDEVSKRYANMYADASAIASDVIAARGKAARKKAVRETRAKMRAKQAEKREAVPSSSTDSRLGLLARGREVLARWR